MARKPRVVPFVPFPRDGDLDGLVQDGTIWERPKGAYLRFIDTGEIWSEYGQVDRDRVEFVRADGSVWDFTPSFRDTDSTTLGGSLGTLADDSPSLLESQGMLPRGVLGPSLAESARFDDAVDDVDVVDVSTDKGSAALAAFRPKIEYLLSDEAVESGLITQASQDRLRGLNNIPAKQGAVINIAARRNRITLFQYMEEQLHGKPTGRSGESPSYRYANFTLGESMAAMLRDGDRKSIDLFRSRLKFLEDEARIRRRSVADMIETVDEDDVRFLQAMAAALPVTTWHDHHIKELINAYAARDFDKVRYHTDWLDRNTASTGRLETQLDLAKQLQYMADNPELIDRLFLQTAGLKDYEYYTGHAFRRSSDSIGRAVASAKSDLAARRADEATELSSTLGIISDSRLVERAGELSGQYQDFDVISQVLRDIETAEIAIQRLEDDGEHTLASQLRERLAELKTELKEVTKPQDIKVVFTEETLKDKKLQGILRFIPGGAENEDLLRKIRKSTDGLSPEYRPTEIRIELLDNNKIGGTFNSATGVLVLTPQMLGLDEHLVIDREAGTIKRFNPDDGPDGLDIPLGPQSLVTLGRLRNDFQEVGLSETPLDQVAVHEAVHRIDSLLAADAFFREKTRLEGEIENIQKQIDDPENARRVTILTETLIRRQEALRELDRQERDGDYIFRNDSPIRQAPQQWISENRPWLETYNRDFELPTRSTDHAYVSSILGYTPNDYLQIKYGVSKTTPGLDPLLKNRMERTESMEVLAEVISAHVTGRRRIPAGTDGEESNLPQMFDKYSKQIIPEELKFILTDRDWSEDDLPPLTALAGRQEADTAYSTDEARRVVRDVDQGKQRGSLLPRVASDPSATSQMLSDAESEDRKNRILGELAQAQVDEPELFRDGVLVDKVWAPFSPPPHLAGSGLRDELAEATSWREVSQLLKGKRVVVFDTETAGRMDPDEVDEDRIVQLGGVVYVDGVIVDRFSMYVNVDYDELSDWSQANLIDADGKPMSPEFLAKQPDMPTVLQEFMRFANGDSDGSDVVFMAHNAAFDLKRMELERQRHDPDGVPSFDLDEVTYFDTMGLGNIAKRAGIEDGPGSASLKKLQEFFGLEDFSWHTADADSEMTGQVLWRLLDYMDENDVPLDGLDPVAGLERQREEFAEYEGKIPEFLRQKERLAELRGLSDQLRSDRDDAVSSMIVMGAEGLDGGEEIPVRAGLFDGPDVGHVPDPVTRDDIARQLGFADAGEMDAATADDPIMASNARILEELATYGFDLAGMDGLSADEMKAKYDAIMQRGPNDDEPYRHGSKPVDTAQIADMLDSGLKGAREQLEFWKNETPESEFGKFEIDRRIAEVEATIEAYESVSPEEAKQLLIDFMRDIFDDPDTTIAVNADGKLDRIEDAGAYLNALAAEERGLLRSGDDRWKTGGVRVRTESEAALMGLHTDVPGQLRPVYGYIVSGAARREARKEALEGNGAVIKYDADGIAKDLGMSGIKEEYLDDVLEVSRETLRELYPDATRSADLPDEEAMQIVADAVNAKIIEKYGPKVFEFDVVQNELEQLRGSSWGRDMMLLDPKVMWRSSFTEGDTINGAGRPVGYRPTMTDQQLLNLAGRAESNPNGSNRGEKLLSMAIRGHDSRFLSNSQMAKDLAEEEKIQQYSHDYIEAQIFGNFVTDEIIASIDGREGSRARHAREVLTDLTPESEVTAIKAQRAAERADQSIEAVSADAASTIDDVDRAVSADPNFGLPPGPDSPTEWDRERLATADSLDTFTQPPTSISALDGEGLREDQKSLNRIVAEASTEEDLVPLREALQAAVEDEGSPLYVEAERGTLREEETFKVLEALDDLIAIKTELGDARGEQQQRLREAEEDLALRLRRAIGYHWGLSRSEVFHWDFLSERVETVLGDEFGVSIQHERREPPSDFESIRNLQEALTPFVDAWARSQYSATQQYLQDNDIREVNLYRGLFIPRSRSSEVPRGTMTDRGVPTTRGLQSWTSRLETALLFLGNKYETAKDEIKKIEDRGERLGMPEHVLLHDVVPAELIFGFASDAHRESFRFGVSVEQEVVVLGGSSRRVNILGDDFLDLHREPSGNFIVDRRESTFRLSEDDVFDYLSSDAEITQSVSANPDFGLPSGPDTPTQWARGRLDKAAIQNSDLPDADLSVVLGDGLREDQKSVSQLLVEASSDDLRELNETIDAYWKAELVKDLRGRQPWVNLSRQLEKLLDKRKETSQRKDLALAEQGVMTELQDFINRSWTSSRDEVMHWDFMSEIVQNVLGDEFGISVIHERREPPSDVESIQKLQELLTPFVDAWARGQYAATQQYLKDNDIAEVNVYRGLFIPTAKGDGRNGIATDRGVGSVRGLQSWTRSLEMALNFAGNRYGTAKNEIAEIEESGEELDLPEHMLLHDVVPAELIFGIASPRSFKNAGFSFGYGKESEVVVLGSSRPVDILGDDFLRTYQISGDTIPEPPTYIAPSSNPTRSTSYRLSENDLFDYLSSETPNDLDTER